ncbi:MAG: tetratricopeptide repeat protein [Roseiarcus sp.]
MPHDVHGQTLSVGQDYAEAAHWYRKAAEQGGARSQISQNILGSMYAEGKGVPQDLVLAHMWLNLAAAQGDERPADENAAQERNRLESRMTREQVAEAQRLARERKAKK